MPTDLQTCTLYSVHSNANIYGRYIRAPQWWSSCKLEHFISTRFAWGIDWNNLRYSALGNVERISHAFKLI